MRVCLLGWGLGLTFGVGTVWLLFYNGLLLGAISSACLRAGMLRALAEFVVGHGSLELPAIWISGGAGLLLAQALLFPGQFRRGMELRLKARQSVEVMVGLIPVLLIAAIVEAFISPSGIPGYAKMCLGAALACGLVAYIASAPHDPDKTSIPHLQARSGLPFI